MKNIIIIITVSIFTLFFNSQIIASEYSGKTKSGGAAVSIAEAIKHAEMAKAHADDPQKIVQHAEKSLEYDKKAEKEASGKGNARGVAHIAASIKHLDEAIKHAKMGHADVASKHIDNALEEMHEFEPFD